MTETSAGGPPASIARRRSRSSRPDRGRRRCARSHRPESGRPPAPRGARSPRRAAGRHGSPTLAAARRQRQRIGLGSAGGEDDVVAARRRPRRDRGPRLLDQPARRAALGMDRRRIAGEFPAPQPSPPAPRGAAAWSRSSRDRPGQASVYVTLDACRQITAGDLIAIGDRRRLQCTLRLERAPDAQEACFLPLASC